MKRQLSIKSERGQTKPAGNDHGKRGPAIAVTQKDIARRVGVSKEAVAHTLSGRGRISAPTREKILRAAQEMGYRPNPLARALTTGRTNLLALWTLGELTPHQMMVGNALRAVLFPSSYDYIHIEVEKYYTRWEQPADSMEFPPADWLVDGAFSYEVRGMSDRVLKAAGDRAPAIVQMGVEHDYWRARTPLDEVMINLRPGADAAMRHLLPRCRRLAMLCLDVMALYDDPRCVAYATQMAAAGRPEEVITFPLRHSAPEQASEPIPTRARQALMDYVRAHGHPDGIFCSNDEVAAAAHSGLAALGLRVPEDVLLCGCDGLPHTLYHVPALSTIVQPFDEMCRIAWEYMQRRLAERDAPPQSTILEAKFEPRASSAG